MTRKCKSLDTRQAYTGKVNPGTESRAFTLIELLVVCTIISILATTALPNYMDAQTRAKATSVRVELKVVSEAYTLYNIDFNQWPNHLDGDPSQHKAVTTPIAYLTTSLDDIFQKPTNAHTDPYYLDSLGQYHCEPRAALYENFEEYEPRYASDTRLAAFYVWSFGPDSDFDGTNQYDVTNGTKSNGDIYKEVVGAPHQGYPYTRIYPLSYIGPSRPQGPPAPGR